VTTIFGGYEATATALYWMWLLLDKHRDVRDRVHVEIDAARGFEELEYGRQVASETLRLMPSFWESFRTARADDDCCGFRVRAGESILVEIISVAGQLAKQLGMPDDKREIAKARLATVLHDPKWREKHGSLPVRGVLAYQMGEGGLLVKVKKGKGVVQWHGGGKTETLQLKSVTFGAQIGGSSEWGFGLVLGIGSPELFGGDYDGTTVSATMGGAGTSMMELTRKNAVGPAAHTVYLIGSSSGASANAGGGKLTIVVTGR
jgi:hypothetical protein